MFLPGGGITEILNKTSFFRKSGGTCQCLVCPHACRLEMGEKGICRVRQNIDGVLLALNYGRICSIASDPIEKKPLYHFYPGSEIFSVGSLGCNLACQFCQNWPLVRCEIGTVEMEAAELVAKARRDNGFGIAYTYNEPLMWFEYLKDAMPLAKEAGLKNVLVTNGFINKKPLAEILPFVDAVNLDLKSFCANTYRQVLGGQLQPVLDNALLFKRNCHLEITTLLVTGINDDPAEILAMAKWIASNLGKDTPFHISRYFPAYKYSQPPTDLNLLLTLFSEVKKIPYVYLGNIQEDAYSETRCPVCDRLVVDRHREVRVFLNPGNSCPQCGQYINIIKNEEE